jgi:hypothetical protein
MTSSADPLLLAAGRVQDGHGSLAPVNDARARLEAAGARLADLHLATLRDGWGPAEDRAGTRFRSGASPILALVRAQALLREGAADAVVIHGRDHLRTGYRAEERRALMAIYPDRTIPEAYTDLTRAFCARHGIPASTYLALRDALLDNHARALAEQGRARPLGDHLLRPVTELLRLVDCANPVVDLEAAVLLCRPDLAPVPGPSRIFLRAAAVHSCAGDVETIARYDHLAAAVAAVEETSHRGIARAYRSGEARLEAYTCYPPVPLAFLLATGIAAGSADLAEALAGPPITVTGGMNFGRAAWNLPALNGLVALVERLTAKAARYAVVHGNGGLGELQGVALLERRA